MIKGLVKSFKNTSGSFLFRRRKKGPSTQSSTTEEQESRTKPSER